VLGLTTSSAGIAGWIGLAAAIVVAALTTATGAYVVWDHWAAPPEVAPAPIAAEAPPPAKSAAPTAPRTLRRSFRNKQFDAELFQWSGPNYKKYVRLEDEGLRITLPAKDGPGDCVGLKLRYPVHGDFDVEATLEFIDVARPERPRGPFGWGAGVTVYFFMDSRDRDGFWVGKLHEREQGPIFSMGHRVKEGADRVNKSSKVVQSVHPDGFARVRAVRKGATFQSFYAEGERGEFQPLSTTVVSDADAIVVRFAADPVWIVNIALDVRLIDFAITADKIVGYEP
jgi:hypothetical protein